MHTLQSNFFIFIFYCFTMAINPFLGWNCLSGLSHTAKRAINQVSKAVDSMPDFASSYYVTGLILIFLASVSLSAEWSGGEGTIMWGTLKLPSKLTAAMPCLKTSCKSGSIKWIFFHFFFSKWVLWQFSIYFFKESLHFPCKWLKVTHWYSKQGIC